MSHQSANPLWLCRVGGHGRDRGHDRHVDLSCGRRSYTHSSSKVGVDLFCFIGFIDASADAPPQNKISHVLVRPKQQRDAERQFNATFHTHAENNINTLKRSQPQFLRKDAKSSSCLSNCAHKQGGTKQDEGKPSSQTATMFTLKRK